MIKRTGHSPGPWSLKPDYKDEYTIVVDSLGDQIAETEGYGAGPTNVKANARLIAAAPELLEALERIADERDSAVEMAATARAAIAKATGDQS